MGESTAVELAGRAIRDEIRVAAPPESVYRAWSDARLIADWFVGRMEGRMEPGETVTWLWDDGGPGMAHRVLVAEPPRRFVTEMELPQGPSRLEVTIEPEEDGSLVRLVQSGFGEGPEWDEQYEAMLSGWMVAMAILKLFLERYRGRRRKEILVLTDASFEREEVLGLERSEDGLARWLTRSGAPGEAVGQPVRLVLGNGETLTGTVLRNTRFETLWSWDEIEGVVEIKAFREPSWGSKVGVRVSSWMDDLSDLADIAEWLKGAVDKLAAVLAEGV
jgi:uncharacterized protein YndB with AHSA1/START domain